MISFSDILEEAEAEGITNTRTATARSWFKQRTSSLSTASIDSIIKSNLDKQASRFKIGKMFTFRYSPKHYQTLPYYDKFPLVFPIQPMRDGFLGVNMHYLPYSFRAVLMDGLYKLASDDMYDDNTKIKITYNALKSISRLKFYKVVVRHYLNSKITSSMLMIPASEWDLALFMPLERFEKKTKSQVFVESRNKL